MRRSSPRSKPLSPPGKHGPAREPQRAEAWFYLGGAVRRAGAVAGASRASACPLLATASASRRRWSARWPSTRAWPTRTSDSVSITTTQMSRPRPQDAPVDYACCRAGIAPPDGRDAPRARTGQTGAQRSEYQLLRHLCVVRKAARTRALELLGRSPDAASAQSPLCRRRWPRSRTSTSTTPPRACGRGRGCSSRGAARPGRGISAGGSKRRLGIASQLDQLSRERGSPRTSARRHRARVRPRRSAPSHARSLSSVRRSSISVAAPRPRPRIARRSRSRSQRPARDRSTRARGACARSNDRHDRRRRSEVRSRLIRHIHVTGET